MEGKERKFHGKRVSEKVWKIDDLEKTDEMEEKYRKINKEFLKGVEKKAEKIERKRREAAKKLREFEVTY